ncbi:molecular chaperone TorD family protein [Slackia exigua]|uniref:TorD/DmsD family molecular chaperone n=1 Tax=Slackia exigua TaxID=84109 RepID=UPI0028D065E2|nr:molecular chaperone TorD family protein [Slackia exigua]
MIQKEAVGRLQEAEALFAMLGKLTMGMPNRDLFATVADDELFSETPFVRSKEANDALEELQAWTKSCRKPFGDADFEAVRLEYSRLFVGAQRVAAPLWESVYFNKERMVFQQETYSVRRAYAKWGLRVENFQHEPDDHLSSELMFVSFLAKTAYQGQGHEGEALADMASFLLMHPSTWVAKWRDEILKRTNDGFYPGYSRLVCAAVREAIAFAEENLRS